VPEAELEYARKLRDVKYNEAVFETLARQLELAKIDEAREGGFLQVVNPATTPERKSFPKRGWITLGAAAFGLSMAMMIVLLQVHVDRMRANPVEAEQLAQLKEAVFRGAGSAEADSQSEESPSAPEESEPLPGDVPRYQKVAHR
jgi:hypothetical protein